MDNQTDNGQMLYVDLVQDVVLSAINNRASDIHFEPQRETFDVRYRVDGILYPVKNLGRNLQEEVTSKIKVLCKMDITEHRLPQDGHFEFKDQDKIYNIRVSTLPGLYGETIVLRIFDREEILIKLESLGLEEDQLRLINNLITSPSGMILTTGPTGSGKTTFLYSILHALNKPDKNIVTLEDPIEFQMAGLRQTNINEAMNLTFAKAMRSVVRQDPDIVMLGEIRDDETAQMAIQAALTGILIFSTFHTFDVPALVTRFIEMGISSSVAAQIIKGVISIRLVRKVCFSCREPYVMTDTQRQFLGLSSNVQVFQRGKGCNLCQAKGYTGRTGIFEIVYFDDEIRAAIIEKKPASYLYELLSKKNIKSLKTSAISKVAQGVTTIEEIVRVMGVFLQA